MNFKQHTKPLFLTQAGAIISLAGVLLKSKTPPSGVLVIIVGIVDVMGQFGRIALQLFWL